MNARAFDQAYIVHGDPDRLGDEALANALENIQALIDANVSTDVDWAWLEMLQDEARKRLAMRSPL